jgi:hypothetical protein
MNRHAARSRRLSQTFAVEGDSGLPPRSGRPNLVEGVAAQDALVSIFAEDVEVADALTESRPAPGRSSRSLAQQRGTPGTR